MKLSQLCVVLSLGVLTAGAEAQQAGVRDPSFEVASIRPSHMTMGCYSELPPGGPSYAITCVSLRGLIQTAYKTDRIQGGGKALDVDHTGLTGLFNLDLSYAPENTTNSQLPSFFTAVEEQLGLRLKAEKITVDTVMIDHVDDSPTEN